MHVHASVSVCVFEAMCVKVFFVCECVVFLCECVCMHLCLYVHVCGVCVCVGVDGMEGGEV